jgi:hypothetical protein
MSREYTLKKKGKICYAVEVKGDDFMQFLFILAVLVPAVWYYAALGKRISTEEKKAGKDLSDEINPFTGAR